MSRRAGIGHAIACRAASLGASLFLQHFSPHDAAQPWGADSIEEVMGSVRTCLSPGARLEHMSLDLSIADAAAQLIREASSRLGRLDALVCNHAASGHDGYLEEISADDLDLHWTVNARSSVLLIQAFQRQWMSHTRDAGPCHTGSVVLITSGQLMGPMPGEIAYATSKAALAGMTPSLADGVANARIRLNTVNPGPVNTGYMDDELVDYLTPRFPFGQMPSPADPARLICWLLTDDASWVTGQVINTEGGFRR